MNSIIPDRKIMPPLNGMAEFDIMKPQVEIMPNGMKLNVIDVGTEDVIRFDLVIGSGQIDQSVPLQAMFANRMLREGTRSMTSALIAEKLDYYGAWLDLSSSVNCGFVTLYSLGKYFDTTIAIVADMVKDAVFPERELQVVVDANKQQYLVNAQRVDVMSRKEINKVLFGRNHPLGKFAEAEDYDRINSGLLKDFYRRFYHSGNCTLYVAGRVTGSVLESIRKHFGQEKWGCVSPVNEVVLPEPCPEGRKRVFLEKADAMQCSLKMGCFFPERGHEDYHDLRVMTTLLGGYFGSRLMSNIREDKGYTYGIAAGMVSYPGSTLMMVSTETANEYIEPVIKEVYKEMMVLQNERVPEEELEMVKNYMLGDLCRAYEGAFSIPDAWIFIQTSGMKEDFFERSVESIRGITAERVMDLAQKYLPAEKMTEVVAGKLV